MAGSSVKKDLPFWAPIHTNAYEAVGDCIMSTLCAEQPRRRPLWDKARSSPDAELVLARRELETSKRELTTKREYQVTKRKEMDDLWAGLRDKERELKESFIKFNKFVKENHEKRERAEQKIHEETAIQARRDVEIRELKDRMAELDKIKQNMEKHIEEYRLYQDYLDRVVQQYREFTSVRDVLDRYDTLAATRHELAARQDRDLHALERARHDLMLLAEEKSKTLMGLNNQLANLWVRYDRVRLEGLQWEVVVTRVNSAAAEKAREVGAVHMMCWNLYRQLCRCLGESVELQPGQHQDQLLFIQRAILQLRAINKLARRNMAREGLSMPANSLATMVGGSGGGT